MDSKSVEKINAQASEERPWTDLPEELLQLILYPLTLSDRFNFARVCKRWFLLARSVPRYDGLSYGFPCLLSITNGGETCILVDPFCNEMHIKCPNLPSQSNILFSKNGWLLMLSDDKVSIFFFNPLAKTRIILPNIEFSHLWAFSFSCPPTSPECMVIAIAPYYVAYVNISLCCRGDKEWTALNFQANQVSFTMSYASPVFYQGSFYCLGDDGKLAVFHPEDSVWHVLSNSPLQDCSKTKQMYLAESERELVMIVPGKFGDTVRISRLDPLTNQWKDLHNLGDRSFFVGRMTSISSKSILTSNRIYFPRIKDGAFMFYSCEEEKFHPSGNFYGSRVFNMSFWIEPVWFQPTSEELKWSE